MKVKIEPLSDEIPTESLEIELPRGNVVSFAGYNATLESITIKAMIHKLSKATINKTSTIFLNCPEMRTQETIRTSKVEVADMPTSMISYLVDVYELVLRAYHFNLERMTTDIESYVLSHVEQEDVKGKLQNLLNNLNNLKYDLLSQMEDYIEMKDFGDFVLTASFHNTFEEKTKSISSQGTVNQNILLPLDVEITPNTLLLCEGRLNDREIPLSLVSMTVSTALLWRLFLCLLTSPSEARIFVIEESEEAMTPLQQVAYAKTLKELAKETPGGNYVVLKTQSPCSATTSNQPSNYFSFENGKFTCKPVTFPPIIKEDPLLLARTNENGGKHE